MSKQLLIGWIVAALGTGSAFAAEPAYAPQVNTAAGVKVTATLKNIESGAKTWDIAVVLETHTQDLGENLTESSVLIADGTRYLPMSWRGDPPGGHHRRGVLRFKAISPRPAAIELQISLGNDAAPRRFQWQLK